MEALTKSLIELEESRREHLTIECRKARLPILQDVIIDLKRALRVCRPALAIEERWESMEKRIAVMEKAVSAPLPTSSSSSSPAAPAQDHALSQAPESTQGEAPISVPPPPSQPWRRPSGERKCQWSPLTQQWPAKRSWDPRTPTAGTVTPRRRRRRGCPAGRKVKSRQQCEGPKPARKALLPAQDNSTVQGDTPQVLNDLLWDATAEMGPTKPHSASPQELMELPTAAEPQSPIEGPLDFRDVCSEGQGGREGCLMRPPRC